MSPSPVSRLDSDAVPVISSGRPPLGRNVWALGAVSFFTDASSEMIFPLLPAFLATVLHASPLAVGAVEGAADSTAALLKLGSGWWSDRLSRRKPLVVLGYGIASFVRPLMAVAQSAGHVLAIRVVDRVGKGIRGAPRDALIADSVHPSVRGRAFGLHRAVDHLGAVIGPLIAFALLSWGGMSLRGVFWMAAIPAALAMVVLVVAVRDVPRPAAPPGQSAPDLSVPLGKRFWAYLVTLLVFTLGNSTDAFLLLRAVELGVPAALIPVIWSMLHVIKSAASVPGGVLSDRIGRRPLIIAGWLVYAAVYFAFGRATDAWHVWALFAAYGIYFGFTEGVERALVADIVPVERRGTAFGWYSLTLAVGALPASLLFGAIYKEAGAATAFAFGAAMALIAAVGIALVIPSRRRPAPERLTTDNR